MTSRHSFHKYNSGLNKVGSLSLHMELTFLSKETWQVMNALESKAAGKEIRVPGQRAVQFYTGRPGKASCRVM